MGTITKNLKLSTGEYLHVKWSGRYLSSKALPEVSGSALNNDVFTNALRVVLGEDWPQVEHSGNLLTYDWTKAFGALLANAGIKIAEETGDISGTFEVLEC